MNTKRSVSLIIANSLLALFSLGNLSEPLLLQNLPTLIIYKDIVLGIIGIVATFGLWTLKRWGMILTIIYSVLQILSAMYGIVATPAPVGIKVGGAVGVVLCIVIIMLVLPYVRMAYQGLTSQ